MTDTGHLISRDLVLTILGQHGIENEVIGKIARLPITQIIHPQTADEPVARGHTLDEIEPGSMAPAHYPWADR